MNQMDKTMFMKKNKLMISPVFNAIITVLCKIYTQNKTDSREYKKLKIGRVPDAIKDLVDSGKMSYSELNKTKNVWDIARRAERHYSRSPKQSHSNTNDFDWYIRFYEAAGNVSNEQMKDIWARILVSEINEPNSISYKTLEILKNMNFTDIKLFAKICMHSVRTFSNHIFLPNYNFFLKQANITYDEIMRLSEHGLISDDTQRALWLRFDENKNTFILSYDKIMIIHRKAGEFKEISANVFTFTKFGIDISKAINSLGRDINWSILKNEIVRYQKNTPLEISLHNIIDKNFDSVRYSKNSILI